VIVSTTVTPGALLELEKYAKELPSSFLGNAKRFNVAVTRAKVGCKRECGSKSG
jgi:superfamily I DNA and/or RNA helicase